MKQLENLQSCHSHGKNSVLSLKHKGHEFGIAGLIGSFSLDVEEKAREKNIPLPLRKTRKRGSAWMPIKLIEEL
jgi:hypothetical protein